MLVDISIPLGPGTPPWPGDTPCSCGWSWEIARGASVNVGTLTTSPHVGTHADAPLHVRDGAPGADHLPLSVFLGRARVCTVPADGGLLDADDVPGLLDAGIVERLLLRTNRSIATGTFPEGWPALTPQAVRILCQRGLVLLGVDAPSVDLRESTTLVTHHALFDAGAYVLENLDLRAVPDGEYELIALPLKVAAIDAAPVRAALRGD